MARKKTITKDQILDAAYEVVATEGFSKFTARNIANKMNCSTQPIYLEFKNMDDLKEELFDKIFDYLEEEVFSAKHSKNIIVDLALNYVFFAKNQTKLYRALFLEEYGGGKKLQEVTYKFFCNEVRKDKKYENFDEERLSTIHKAVWIVATGVAGLVVSGIITPTDEQLQNLIQASVELVLTYNGPSIDDLIGTN